MRNSNTEDKQRGSAPVWTSGGLERAEPLRRTICMMAEDGKEAPSFERVKGAFAAKHAMSGLVYPVVSHGSEFS
jgi:hypothetical protein